jgi:hypothetical protein
MPADVAFDVVCRAGSIASVEALGGEGEGVGFEGGIGRTR